MAFPDYTKQPDKVPVSEEIDLLWEELRRVYKELANLRKKFSQLESV